MCKEWLLAAQAHPDDVIGDTCAICGGSEDIATDWISCDQCDQWVHFSCDQRSYLGAFKDYSKGQGQNYTCPTCHDKRQRTNGPSPAVANDMQPAPISAAG